MSSLMACIAGCGFRRSGMALSSGADHWKVDFEAGKMAARILQK